MLLPSKSLFALDLPANLDKSDRLEMIRILGMATSSKSLSNPYPLGGFPGFEFGVSLEVINTRDLSQLGDKAPLNNELRYPRFSIGKGLYHNLDLFLHFIPYSKNTALSEYGGMVKWSFYQAKFLPINFSGFLHTSSVNVNDSFSCLTLGGDIMVGINANNFSLYFGGGQLRSQGRFMGTGANGIVSSPNQTGMVSEKLIETHSFLGVSLHFLDLFAAAQIDRYRDPVYSAKIGIRL